MENDENVRNALKKAILAVNKAKEELATLKSQQHAPIAIIGMGCRFPGGANDPETFWQLLAKGFDGITEVPKERWDINTLYDPSPETPGKMYTRFGGFLNVSIDQFDADFFGISPRETENMDPQQRLVLEVAWEALENAAINPKRLEKSPTGVFFGVCETNYLSMLERHGSETDFNAYVGTGNAHSVIAGRLSYFLGLQGPSMAIDTACSSSLVALHTACQSLRAGECHLALAGGVNLILTPELTISFCQAKMLAADGQCKTFDASANGYVRSEGCGVVVLKGLSEAQRDGDRILGVIKGSAVNQDGASSGLTVPNGEAQAALLRSALAQANLLAKDIDYIEAHGTGTSLGDPIEVHAIGEVLKASRDLEHPLWIGSVKTNIGHLEGAAGIAGIIKLVLALQHAAIPPHIHFAQLNPLIALDAIPAKIPLELVAWPHGKRPRIGGVSSFGFSGTNAHVIIEEAPLVSKQCNSIDRPLHLLTLSAKNESALRDEVAHFQHHLQAHPEDDLADLCFTANTGRAHFGKRLAIIAQTTAELLKKLTLQEFEISPLNEKPKIAFLFTGQGSNYPKMGKILYDTQPVFRSALDGCAEILSTLLDQPLLELLFHTEESASAFHQPIYMMPSLLAFEYALTMLWKSWGVVPDYVMGHSSGEYTAATIAGIISLEDAFKLTTARGRLVQSLPTGGAMLAVMTDAESMQQAFIQFGSEAEIAAVNGPEQIVIAGKESDVSQIENFFKLRGAKTHRLEIPFASHSKLVEPILDEFRQIAQSIAFHPPHTDLISNLTGEIISAASINADYWVDHLRHAVCFYKGMELLHALHCLVFLEIGPHPVLLGMGMDCQPNELGLWLPSLRKEHAEWSVILDSLSQLYLSGVQIDWKGFDAPYHRYKVAIPTYAFQRTRHWIDLTQAKMKRTPYASKSHPLLGALVTASIGTMHVFENALDLINLPYLKDHRIYHHILFPAAGFIELALTAGKKLLHTDALVLENISIQEALSLTEDQPKRLQTWLEESPPGKFTVSIYGEDNASAETDKWHCHATASVCQGQPDEKGTISWKEALERCHKEITPSKLYQATQSLGLDYGPAFQSVQKLWIGESEAAAEVRITADATGYTCHPALLDGCLQVLIALVQNVLTKKQEVYLPVGIDRFQINKPLHSFVKIYGSLASPLGQDVLVADFYFFDGDDHLIASINRLRVKKTTEAALLKILQRNLPLADLLYAVKWHNQLGLNPIERPITVDYFPPFHTIHEGKELQYKFWAEKEEVQNISKFNLARKQLCVDFVQNALTRLDIKWLKGQNITEESIWSQTQILPQHKSLFKRLLDTLSDEGLLFSNQGGWQFQPPLKLKDVKEAGAKLLAAYPAFNIEIQLLRRCGEHLVEVLQGKQDPLQLIFPASEASSAENLYEKAPLAKVFNHMVEQVISWLIAKRPLDRPLRILEIGAGSGGTSSFVLPCLSKEQLIDQIAYVYTDISPLFLTKAQSKFSAYPFIRYALLDIEKDPQVQGFARHQFDIIIAANTLHATQDMHETLQHIHQLLVAQGALVLLEGIRPEIWLDLTFGLLEGWWRFKDTETRPNYPLLAPAAWEKLLQESGFRDVAFLAGGEGLEKMTQQAVILAQRSAQPILINKLEKALWVIFADSGQSSIALALTDELEQHSQKVALIYPHDTSQVYSRSENDIFHIDPNKPSDFIKLITDLSQERIQGFVYLWGLENNSSAKDHTTDDLMHAQQLTCSGVIHLVQALKKVPLKEEPKLWLITQGSQSIESEIPEGFSQATLWGIGKVIFIEHPDLRCTLIDLDPMKNACKMGYTLFNELWNLDRENQVVYRHDKRYVARLVKENNIQNQPSTEMLKISSEGSYLITGGLGGLGLKFAEWLALQGAKHIILAGRRPPDEASEGYIKALLAKGAQIETIQLDVADKVAVTAVINQFGRKWPELKGVLHAAGVVDDAALMNQNWNKFSRVFGPKVYGGWNLHHATQHLSLDYFILFSSIAGLLGSSGQSNHAAADAFLDALAHYRHAKGLAGLSINWGAWSEIGDAADKPHNIHLEPRGIGYIDPLTGLRAFHEILMQANRIVQIGVTPIDWKKYFECTDKSQAWYSEIIQSLDTSYISPEKSANLIEILQESPAERKKEVILDFVRSLISRIIKMPPGNIVDKKGFFEMGMDSLMAVEVKNALKNHLGKSFVIPATLVFDYPSVNKLADYLEQILVKKDLSKEPSPNMQKKNRLEEPLIALEKINDAPQMLRESVREPIAVIGMGCRFPGGSNNPQAYWDLLEKGRSGITLIPNTRWDNARYYDPDPEVPGKIYINQAGLIDQIDLFDSSFFGISPKEVLSMDPQHRILLEVALEALMHACQTLDKLANSKTGVFVGTSSHDYFSEIIKNGDLNEIDAYLSTGNSSSSAAGRLSYFFDFKGPAMAIDTACSSSLVALHLACQSLRTSECQMALACGINLILSPEVMINMCKAKMLSPEGKCKTFDERADGFVRGEGCGVIVLKKISDAKRDGDRILALVHGSAVNEDGSTAGFTVPNGWAQQEVMRQALINSGIRAEEVGYVEAHGTGTSLGDPIELRYLSKVYNENRIPSNHLIVGSVKTNIGHLESASGIAGIIKLVLALQHQLIPAHLNFTKLNPHIGLEASHIVIPTENLLWKVTPGNRRIAAISSFGFNGTNAHAILEEAPIQEKQLNVIDRPMHLLTVSAKTEVALQDSLERYRQHLTACPLEELADLAYTANTGRDHFKMRIAIVCKSTSELLSKLSSHDFKISQAPVQSPRIAFVFTEEPSAHPQMGKQLYYTQPVFKEALDRCVGIFDTQFDTSLLETLFPSKESFSKGDQIYDTQGAHFAFAYALAELWESWGIIPACVMGFGWGEYVAAIIAKILTLEDACKLFSARANLMKSLAAHADLSEALTKEFRKLAQSIAYHEPQMEMLSHAHDKMISSKGISAEYWLDHLRHPLQPDESFMHWQKLNCQIFLAIGPRFRLWDTQQIQDQPSTPRLCLDSLRCGEDDWQVLLESLTQLYLHGVQIDWKGFDSPYHRQMVTLPSYPFQRQSYWVKAASVHPPVAHKRQLIHPLLGEFISSPSDEKQFENEIDLTALSYLKDYQIYDSILFPTAGFVELVLAAGRQLLEIECVVIESLTIQAPLLLTQENPQRIQLLAKPEGGDKYSISLYSQKQDPKQQVWYCLLKAQVISSPIKFDLPLNWEELRQSGSSKVSILEVYQSLKLQGMHYGKLFQTIQELWIGENEVIAELHSDQELECHCHPLLLDGCLQALVVLANRSISENPENRTPTEIYWPIGIDKVTSFGNWETTVRMHGSITSWSEETFSADFKVFSADGTVLTSIEGFRARKTAQSDLKLMLKNEEDVSHWSYQIFWRSKPVIAAENPIEQLTGTWLLFVDKGEISLYMLEQFKIKGIRHIAIEPNNPLYQNKEDILKLLQEISRADSLQGILFLWGAALPLTEPTLDSILTEQRLSLKMALHLVQALITSNPTKLPLLNFVTVGIQPVADFPTTLILSPFIGFYKTLCFENPELLCRHIDLDPQAAILQNGPHLLNELSSKDRDDQIAYRQGQCYVPRLLHLSTVKRKKKELNSSFAKSLDTKVQEKQENLFLQPPTWPKDLDPPKHLSIDPQGGYLITGGLGGIGLKLAEWLVLQGSKFMVLAGRNAPPPLALEMLEKMRNQGVNIETIQIDISDSSMVAALIQKFGQSWPELKGIVHAAGIIDDGALLNQNWTRFEKVFASKIAGGWNLHANSLHKSLDFFILFSSIASVLGAPGQSNYAAANAFLDELAHYRFQKGLPALSISWGPWQEVGMAAQLAKQHKASGLTPFTPEQGIKGLEFTLKQHTSHILLAKVDWKKLLQKTSGDRPFFSEILPLQQNKERHTNVLAQLQRAMPDNRDKVLREHLRQLVRKILGLSPHHSLTDQQELFESGMDSLMALELKNHLQNDLGKTYPLSSTLAFDHPTIEALTLYLKTALFPEERNEKTQLVSEFTESESKTQSKTISAENQKALRLNIPKEKSWVSTLALNGILKLMQFIWEIKVEGISHLPKEGPYLLCPNHASHLDPFFLTVFLNSAERAKLYVMGKKENLENIFTAVFANLLGAIPVDRTGDVEPALQACLSVLLAGNILIIFPEGTRTRDGKLGVFRKGAARLSRMAKAPVIPVYIKGAFELFPPQNWLPHLFNWRKLKRFEITIVFGEPLVSHLNPLQVDCGDETKAEDEDSLFTQKLEIAVRNLIKN